MKHALSYIRLRYPGLCLADQKRIAQVGIERWMDEISAKQLAKKKGQAKPRRRK